MAVKSLDELNMSFISEVPPGSYVSGPANIPPAEAKPAPRPETGTVQPVKMKFPVTPSKRRIKTRGILAVISGLLLGLMVLLVLFSVFNSGKDGNPKTIAGYSYYNVLTASMQNEIPKGSFILVKRINPAELEIGDTITYTRDHSTTVTHKIIDIYENFQNDGVRGFRTKGTNDAIPDRNIVYEADVVGKVVFSLPAIGAVMSHLGANIHVMFIIFGLCVILSALIQRREPYQA